MFGTKGAVSSILARPDSALNCVVLSWPGIPDCTSSPSDEDRKHVGSVRL